LTPSAKREAVQIMTQEHGLSVQRACSSAQLSRAAYYRPVQDRSAADAETIAALNELVAVELRWGFWKCYDRLRQMGKRWNHKRVYRAYCQLRLNHKRRAKRRLVQRPRQPLFVTAVINAHLFAAPVSRHRRLRSARRRLPARIPEYRNSSQARTRTGTAEHVPLSLASSAERLGPTTRATENARRNGAAQPI
jgi:hypothetical protein